MQKRFWNERRCARNERYLWSDNVTTAFFKECNLAIKFSQCNPKIPANTLPAELTREKSSKLPSLLSMLDLTAS